MKLKAVRQAFIAGDLCRGEVNKRTRRIVRMFKWAVAEELLPASVHQAPQGRRRTTEGPSRRPGVQTHQASPGCLRGRHPRQRGPAGLDDDRTPTSDRHAAGRGLHDAIVRPEFTGQDMRISANRSQDRSPRESPGYLHRPAGAATAPAPGCVPTSRLISSSPLRPKRRRRVEMRNKRKTRVQPSQRCRKQNRPRRTPGRPVHDRELSPGDRQGLR